MVALIWLGRTKNAYVRFAKDVSARRNQMDIERIPEQVEKDNAAIAAGCNQTDVAEDVEMAKTWTELESNFLNRWMNRRLWKRWEEHLQDTSPHTESS